MIINERIKDRILPLIFLVSLIILYLFAPFSISSSAVGLVLYFVIFVLVLLSFGTVQIRMIPYAFLGLLLIVISSLLTLLINPDNIIASNLGVLLIVFSTLFVSVFVLKIQSKVNLDCILIPLNVIVFIWGIMYIFHFSPATDFFYKIYSNGDDPYFWRSIYLGKPVMSLRFHGRAGYAYGGMFLLNYFRCNSKSISLRKKIFYFAHLIILDLYIFLLQSNAGVIMGMTFAVVLLLLLFKFIKIDRNFGLIVFIAVLFFVIIFNYRSIFTELSDLASSDSNGFLGRYINNKFTENVYYILRGGIGFYTVDNVFLSDSGILVSLTRGSIAFTVVFYACIIKFIISNFRKEYAIPIILFLFSYELAYTNLIGVYNGLTWLILFKFFADNWIPTSSPKVKRWGNLK